MFFCSGSSPSSHALKSRAPRIAFIICLVAFVACLENKTHLVVLVGYLNVFCAFRAALSDEAEFCQQSTQTPFSLLFVACFGDFLANEPIVDETTEAAERADLQSHGRPISPQPAGPSAALLKQPGAEFQEKEGQAGSQADGKRPPKRENRKKSKKDRRKAEKKPKKNRKGFEAIPFLFEEGGC